MGESNGSTGQLLEEFGLSVNSDQPLPSPSEVSIDSCGEQLLMHVANALSSISNLLNLIATSAQSAIWARWPTGVAGVGTSPSAALRSVSKQTVDFESVAAVAN
jgi:hypothetical protein